jgi:chromosomal replication initiator protein
MNMNKAELWQSVLIDLQMSLSKPVYEFYIKKLDLVDVEVNDAEKVAVIACPSAFMLSEVKKRLFTDIRNAFQRANKDDIEIKMVVKTMTKPGLKLDEPLFRTNNNQDMFTEEVRVPVAAKVGLSPELTLETYAVSSSNEMAYAAVQAVSKSPGKAYNPLFLYGGVGVGKTHLMQGAGQEILKKKPGAKIIYCTGEEFTNGIVEAIQQKSTAAFKRKFRTVDLLLIDDIQFIAGKTTVQEEFFHTFNAILKGGGQVIMTSDKPPQEINALEERLKSRFEGGLTIDIGQPDFELRSAILMIKATQMGLEIPMDVAQIVASQVKNTRALLGSLMKIKTLLLTKKEAITAESVKKLLAIGENINKERKTHRPLDVIKMVADYYNTQVKDIRGVRRVKNLVLPRHVAMYILKEDLGLGLVEIGGWFGNRDHTSVIHAVDKVGELVKNNDQISSDLGEIRKRLLIN